MTRFWAARHKAMQQAIHDQVLAERLAQDAQLPAALQVAASNLHVAVSWHPDRRPDKPFVIQILPPQRSRYTGQVSAGLEGEVEIPCMVSVKAGEEADLGNLLLEVVGLLMDAVDADDSLGGLCGGWGEQAIEVADLLSEPGVVGHSVALRFKVRSGPGT